jgi:heparinase II/III-like protein
MHRGDRVDGFRGGHRGYERLASPIRHTRECFVDRQQPRVLIRDRLDGTAEHAFAWRFHIDPAVIPEVDGCDVRLSCDGKALWLLPDRTAAAFSLSIEEGWVSPTYGVKVPSNVLVWAGRSPVPLVASYLFADVRFTPEERAAVSDSLCVRFS